MGTPSLIATHCAIVGAIQISHALGFEECASNQWAYGPICNVISAVVTLPKGTDLMVMVYALHTDGDYWSGDPFAFDPGRWLSRAHPSGAGRADGEGNLSPRSTLSDTGVKGAFVPFLDGQRLRERLLRVGSYGVMNGHTFASSKQHRQGPEISASSARRT